jgi:RNA polymerase sigma-70 factor (ECF subfamily)
LEPNDLHLCRAAAGGDHGAFHALIDRHARGLFRVAVSLSASRSDAEDLCQETFTAAFRGLKRFDGRASVKTWLTRILMCRAATLWKKQRHERRTFSLHGSGDFGGQRADGESGSLADRLGVPSTINAVEDRMDILAAIRSLTPEFRDAIILREIDGLSYQEIADTLGVPRGTVESRLHRARAELARKLAAYRETGSQKSAAVGSLQIEERTS